MQPDSRKLLSDMQDAARAITEFVTGKTPEMYVGDRQLRMAVERGFEIVGEALSQLRKVDPAIAESITDWQAIIGFRNVLIHGYGQVNDMKTWDIAQTEIPILLDELAELLK